MKYIIGSDEVGYGALAGPLITCAVAVPEDWVVPEGMKDSKALKNKGGHALLLRYYKKLWQLPIALTRVENTAIDEMGVWSMLLEAHTQGIERLLTQFPDADIIVDGTLELPRLPQARCMPKADEKIPAVMAASIIAKVNRDEEMKAAHLRWPQYGFKTNAGYGSKQHQTALDTLGPTPLHRLSYGQLKLRLEA